jgi:hypothetical protein
LAPVFDAFWRSTEPAYFGTSIERELGSHHPGPPILASKIHPKTMFFQGAFPDLIFLHFILIFYEKVRFCHPLWDRPGFKMASQIAQVAPKW